MLAPNVWNVVLSTRRVCGRTLATNGRVAVMRKTLRRTRGYWHGPGGDGGGPTRVDCRSLSTNVIPTNTPLHDGLFAIPELQTPSDFLQCAVQAMHQCDQLRDALGDRHDDHANSITSSSLTKSCAVNRLYQLDEISRVVCNVIDAAELCRSTHASEEWRDAAHRAFVLLSDYIAQLNTDPRLYRSLTTIFGTSSSSTTTTTSNSSTAHVAPSVFPELTTEEQRFALLLRAEFERDGIHLPEHERAHVRNLQASLTALETSFSRNLVTSHKTFAAHAQDVADVLPPHVLQAYHIVVPPVTHESSTVQLGTSEPQILQTLLRYSNSPSLRRQVYLESHTAVPENLEILDGLVRVRYELAQALGFDSYADRFLRDKMAAHPSNVASFLQTLQRSNAPLYRQEMAMLSQAKQQVEGNDVVEPWDVPFYIGLLKTRDDFDVHDVSEYLTLPQCLDGMKTLVDKLFGINMQECELTDNERWDGPTVKKEERIRRFDFLEKSTGRKLGTIYLDLHPREGKYGHAAHFTVRCGCVLNGPSDPPKYQYPIVALVCNMSSTNTNLSHAEVETLFHEFGHALHSLLSRTRFQHMSGTRAAMDFVETPSHWMENYAWDTDFLKILAVHPQTGASIPDELIRALQKSRYEFAAIERQSQILYATFDQKLFGVPTTADTTALFGQLHREIGVPYTDGTHWHSRFGHLVTYGAGYYGYLYAQVFAGDIWRHLFQGRSMERKSGDELWHKVLIHGGAKDPSDMLTDLLGRPPQVNSFGQ
jgi:intermediate peptidase